MPVAVQKHRLRRPDKAAGSVPRSQTERLWLIGGGTVAVLLTVIAYFFFISPQRSETADVRAQVADAKTENTVLQHKLAALREQNKSLARYQQDLAAARRALPSASGVSDFVRSLQVLGAQTQTDVASLSVGQPAPVAAAAPAAATSATSSSPSSAAPGPAAGSAPRPSAVYSLAISAQVTGSPADLNRFLDQLQRVQPRAVLITAISETTGTTGSAGTGGEAARPSGATTLQLTMLAFVTPGAAAGASPAAPGSGR
jgi:type II secretory pathway component PulM